MKLIYAGKRTTEFSSGRCPSGNRYQVVPGVAFEVDAADGEFLLAQKLYAPVTAPKPKAEPKEDKGGL